MCDASNSLDGPSRRASPVIIPKTHEYEDCRGRPVVFSQEWYHFFSQPDPPRVGSTPVDSNALHHVLRAFESTGVRTAVAPTDVKVVEEVVPSEGVTDIGPTFWKIAAAGCVDGHAERS